MTINQFLKSLGLEHLRDIFQREQVQFLGVFFIFLGEDKSEREQKRV